MPGHVVIDRERTQDSIPTAGTEAYRAFLDDVFLQSEQLLQGSEDTDSAHWIRVSKRLFNGTVICKTRTEPKCGSYSWHQRLSYHATPSYEEFREYLYKDHTPNEKHYLEGLSRTDCIKVIEKDVAEIWLNSYKLPFPTTNRDFCVLVLFREGQDASTGSRKFTITSLPIAHSAQKGYVRGLYSSIEQVREVELKGKKVLEWRMQTMSNPQGSLPAVITEKVIETQIARDVPDFFKYLEAKGMRTSSETIA